ncbi:hypothetical protein ACQ0MK_17355 [Thalassospira lucentensis]|uniref:hypothetical protein n=1 Tax=Thalassospira lucentensis TaxID=168935 RepID=UPI003D2ED4C5
MKTAGQKNTQDTLSRLLGMAIVVSMVFCFEIKTVLAEGDEDALRIVVADDVLEDYERFLNGRTFSKITDFGGPYSRRDVVEIVLVQQALSRGGWTGAMTLIGGGNYARMRQMISVGEADISGSSVWRRDIEEDGATMIASHPVIPVGRFEAGFYMLADNPNRLRVHSLLDIRRMRAVSNRTWKPDWHALEKLDFSDLVHVPTWQLMVQFIADDRADFLLAPFQPGSEMELVVDGVRMLPIPGFKIALAGSRHFAVNKTVSDNTDLLAVLNRGLKALEDDGIVDQAYRQSGFFHPVVRDWTLIGAEEFGQSDTDIAPNPDNSMKNQIFSLRDINGRLYPNPRLF